MVAARKKISDDILSQFDVLWRIKKTLVFEIIETNFEKHDDNNLETTLTYKKLKSVDSPLQKYLVEFYFFLPASVIPEGFSATEFLGSLTNHIRLRSFDIPPSEFLSNNPALSPLAKLEALSRTLLEDPEMSVPTQIVDYARQSSSYILHTLKTLDIVNYFSEDYDVLEHYETELRLISELLFAYRTIIASYRQLFGQRLGETIASLSLIDEHMSHYAEKMWLKVLKEKRVSDSPELIKQIKQFLTEEAKHRVSFQFLPTMSADDVKNENRGETYTYRLALLKKFVQKQLYLDVKYAKASGYAVQSAAMVGALFAATFASLADLMQRGVFGLSWQYNALLLISASSLIYVAKDRIKDLVKSSLTRKWSNYDLRRQISLRGDSQVPFAHTVEKVMVENPEKVPQNITDIRHQQHYKGLQRYDLERVISYKKTLTINWEKLQQNSYNRTELKEIYRFNLSPFLEHMSNSKKEMSFFDAQTGEVVTAAIAKVYHINLVLSLCPYKDQKTLDTTKRIKTKIRIVLDKDGIKRVEHVVAR